MFLKFFFLNFFFALKKLKKLPQKVAYTDRKNVTNFLYLVLHLACKITCYFPLFCSVLVSVLRTSNNVLSKSKSRNYVTWIANLTKLFLSVYLSRNSVISDIFHLLPAYCPKAQMAEVMFQNVVYRTTEYRTGISSYVSI